MFETFHLPIYYNNQKKLVDKNIISDLELTNNNNIENENGNCLYDYVFEPTNKLGKINLDKWKEYFTTDTLFLKESQTLCKKVSIINYNNESNINKIMESWKSLKSESNFKENNFLFDWDKLEPLNNSVLCLFIYSILNISSPIISLLFPILFLFIPFFIIKFKKFPITMSIYIELLKKIIFSTSLGKIFLFSELSWEKRFYALGSVIFYMYQVYQNIMMVVKFHQNMILMHDKISHIQTFIKYTLLSMQEYLHTSQSLKSYNEFNQNLIKHKNNLEILNIELGKISPYEIKLSKIWQLGHILKYYYQCFKNKDIEDSMNYAFGFNGYLDNLIQLQKNKYVNPCVFSKKPKLRFKNAYYIALKDKNPVMNSYQFKNNNMIITGPNAAGKTTLLKSTLFNLILCQQIGFGAFEKAVIFPYQNIHCYLNIPDTNGRDSLFQAEARRCKDILIKLMDSSNENHFCIFDELYSGTNPYEAVASAISYLTHLSKNNKINFMLTTHYINLCKSLDTHENIKNYHMKINKKDEDFEYTYKLKEGISTIRGGISVLKDLEYPEEIIELTKHHLSEM